MIKPARFLAETQDLFCRRVYVIRPRVEFLQRLIELDADSEDREYLGTSVVVLTEEAPFERDMEGWRRSILRKCKEAFLTKWQDNLGKVGFVVPDVIFADSTQLSNFFDEWWTYEEAEHLEIVAGCWKS